MAKRKKSWQKEPEQIEKRRVKDAARSAAYKQEQLEKGMLARNTALNKMGYNGAGHVEVYKTETQAARLQDYYGIEPTPAPIKTIDASVDPPEIIEYPERPGANELEQVDNLHASAREPAALPPITAQFDAQAGLIAKRMRRARAVLRTAIGNSPRITMKHGP